MPGSTQRRAWRVVTGTNGRTHITITADKKGKPSGAVDISRGGGTIAKVTDDGFDLSERGFGNPFVVAGARKKTPAGMRLVESEADAVEQYADLLWDGIKSDPAFADRVADLSGRELWYYQA